MHIPIRILGTPTAVVGGLPVVFPAKGFQLIALLARSPSGTVRRREAASLLWSRDTGAVAFANLRQLLSRIRRLPAPIGQLVSGDTKVLVLGPSASAIDLCEFERAIGSDSLPDIMAGLGLFRGDLLEAVTDATDDFQHWLTGERASLRERFFGAASAALMELTRFGRASDGDLRAIGGRMLALQPGREATYRILIEAFGRNGNFLEAESLYGELAERLGREHGTAPTPETAAVARRVLAAARSGGGDAPTRQETARPRVAFLAPRWLSDEGDPALLRVLIEDVANELARCRSFAVLAPHSAFQVDHDSGMPVGDASLHADFTVSGFVRPGGDGDVLVLRMVRCATAEIAWAGDFPIAKADLTGTFRRLAIRVASSLATTLERDDVSGLGRGALPDAYRQYLQGQIYLKHCDLPRLRRARSAFRQAAACDHRFAAPHARIAQTLYLEWLMLGGNDPMLLRSARQDAEIAIDLDPDAALGYWMKGAVALYQRDFDQSAELFAEAETLNPNSADLLLQHGDALACFGRPDEGWPRFQRAIELNPLPPDHYWWAGASIALSRSDFAGAIELCGRLGDDEPVLRILAACHARSGNIDRARGYAARLRETYPGCTASDMAKRGPFRDSNEKTAFIESLRLAGLP